MIDTVLFDMGGTLEDIRHTPQTLTRAAHSVADTLKKHSLIPSVPESDMETLLSEGLRQYNIKRDENFMELKPERIWADYLLCGMNLDRQCVERISEELACTWENEYFERCLRPGVYQMLQGLDSLGLKLGIISNTASLFQVFNQLEKYGIRDFFRDVTLSSQVGYRKPHPNIFKVALLQMRSDPRHSVYVGDTVSRDIIGSKQAGFAFSVLIHSQLTYEKDEVLEKAPRPDFSVEKISDVLQVCQSLMS